MLNPSHAYQNLAVLATIQEIAVRVLAQSGGTDFQTPDTQNIVPDVAATINAAVQKGAQ